MPDAEMNTYDDLPPTQSLVLEVLSARYRLGENSWTFSARHRLALEGLAERGLLCWKHGVMPRTCVAWLTDEGRRAVLSTLHRSDAVKLLEEALFLRMNGERAPGGNETWHDWDLRAERFLRSLLPEPDAGPRGDPGSATARRDVRPPTSGAVVSASVKTNILDRFNAWIGDPDTPPEPTLQDAFAEGFAQAMEWISGQPRVRNADGQ